MTKRTELNYWVFPLLLLALLLAFLLTRFFPLARVVGPSMQPVLQENDWVLAAGYLVNPNRGDVVLVQSEALGQQIVKRVLAVPGDRVEIYEGALFVNGVAVPQDPGAAEDFPTAIVPPDRYFLLGDNRQHSQDSRHWAVPFVPKEEIRGRVLYRLFPLFSAIA